MTDLPETNNIKRIRTSKQLRTKIKETEKKPALMIPGYSDYEKFEKLEYKLNELREICKVHALKKSGTKQDVKIRIYDYLRQSHYITKIQRVMRRKFLKLHIQTSGPAYNNRTLCVNETDFYSLEKMTDIPRNQFISFKDETGLIYGFDILSLYTHYTNELCSNNSYGFCLPSNPYNRLKFPGWLQVQMHKKIRLTDILGISCKIEEEEEESILSISDQDDQLLFLIFQEMNLHGHYADTSWFNELNVTQMVRFVRELADIWNYRAQLLPTMKNEICPPNGDPFRVIDARTLHPELVQYDLLKHQSIALINLFVRSGTNRDNRSLGTYYVLSALTLVSASARIAMPWLYESVAQYV